MDREEKLERLEEALREELGEAVDCTRVWEAWGYGTMSETDFILLADQPDRMRGLAEAVLNALEKPVEEEDRPAPENPIAILDLAEMDRNLLSKSATIRSAAMYLLEAKVEGGWTEALDDIQFEGLHYRIRKLWSVARGYYLDDIRASYKDLTDYLEGLGVELI